MEWEEKARLAVGAAIGIVKVKTARLQCDGQATV